MYRELLQSGIQVKIIGDSIAAGCGSSDDDRSGPVILTVGGRDHKEQLGKKCWASLFGAYVRGLYPASRVVTAPAAGWTPPSCGRISGSLRRRRTAWCS